MTQLQNVTDTLYRTFARYPLPSQAGVSPFAAISQDDINRTRSKPLRSLVGRDLAKYSMKALTTWGDDTEFRHFLPRMFELISEEPTWTDVPTIFEKLNTARWRQWPHDEQDAIERYASELWGASLRGETRVSLGNLALGISSCGISFAPLAMAWGALPTRHAALQLCDLITLKRKVLLESGSFGREWSDEARAALDSLVRSRDVLAKLEAFFADVADPVESQMLSDALGIMEVIANEPL